MPGTYAPTPPLHAPAARARIDTRHAIRLMADTILER